MQRGLTEIIAIVDRSGSMANVAKDMEGGYTAFIQEQARQPGECRVTLVTFDSEGTDTLYDNVPAALATKMTLTPRGMTPLWDAVGRTIDSVGMRYARTPEWQRPERVVVVIVTDGEENASHQYSSERVRGMITHQQQQYSWQFVYLGANVDAFAVARTMGIPITFAASYRSTARGIADMYQVVSNSVSSYRADGSAEFTETMREQLNGSDDTVVGATTTGT